MRKENLKRGMAYGLAFAMAASTILPGNFASAEEDANTALTTTTNDTAATTTASDYKVIEPKASVVKEYTVNSNPIVLSDEKGEPLFCGDPSVLVDGDTVYLYTGHDQGVAAGAYVMPDYLCFSTQDFKTWKYYGPVMNMEDVSWTNDNVSAWAGQVMRYNDKYYMYFCSWDKTSEAKQSIGVAVADNPTGPFVDIGEPLVKGTFTTTKDGDSTASNWNDIDPTAWIETDENGEDHRYLMWGNNKEFVCELNEDMISVKDLNGDGQITFGAEVDGASSKTADVIEKPKITDFAEAPWIYRRQDENGKYYGDYYIFHANKFPEWMAYSTTKDLINGTYSEPHYVMEATATSDTNHMAVFDFKGKTYFIYHDGMLQGGFGQRRIPCITELKWNEDGSAQVMNETVSGDGFFDTELSTLYSYSGKQIFHADFSGTTNLSTGEYPKCNVKVGELTGLNELNGKWVLSDSLIEGTDYVSIQSENKPGFFITANSDGSATLSHPADVSDENKKLQTFKQVKGLADENGISFESVSQPGKYLAVFNGSLYVASDAHDVEATFYKDQAPAEALTKADAGTENALTKLEAGEDDVAELTAGADGTYELAVDPTAESINVKVSFSDAKGHADVNGTFVDNEGTASVKLGTDDVTNVTIKIIAENGDVKSEVTLNAKRDYDSLSYDFSDYESVKVLNFENQDDGAVTTANIPGGAAVLDAGAAVEYTDGVHGGKAAKLSGAYGLKLLDNLSSLGESYSVSFWMNPTVIKSGVDPILALGTFSPEYWINVTHTDRGVWAHANDIWYDNNTTGTPYTANEWQHVVLVVDNGKVSLYRDGKAIEFTNRDGTEGEVPTGITANAGAAIYFGVNGWDAIFEGAVDEAIIFKGALGEEEVLALTAGLKTAADFTSTYVPSAPSNNNTNNNASDDEGLAKGKTFTAGNFKYKVTKAGKAVSVTGLSAKGKKASSLSLAATVKKSGVSYKVTALAANAFKGAKAKKITLNKNIKKLPKKAFANCKNLTTLTLKAKLTSVDKTAFTGCTKTIKIAGTSAKANLKLVKKSSYKKFK